jgi:hypothetical protein
MEQPIYKLWMMRYTDAWYKLSPEEQQKHLAKIEESLKKVGGELLMMRVSVWASEEWLGWGVEKYPNLEALQQHAMTLYAMNHFHYVEGVSHLGVEMPPM